MVVDAGTVIEMVVVQDLTGNTVVGSFPIHIEECPCSMYYEIRYLGNSLYPGLYSKHETKVGFAYNHGDFLFPFEVGWMLTS